MSLPQVTSWFDGVMLSNTAALVTFLSFIPGEGRDFRLHGPRALA